MRKARGLLVLVGVLGVTGVALAAPPPWSNSRYNRASSEYDYAPVTRVEPIVRQVRIETPRRECYDDVRYVESAQSECRRPDGARRHHRRRASATRSAAATAGMPRQSRARRSAPASVTTAPSRRYGSETREEVVQRCDVRYEHEYEERIDGYRVTYEYNGREYTTRLPYDPGERIKVRVAVAPAE